MGTNMQDIQFLSTLSLRRATAGPKTCAPPMTISIHALLAESDARCGGGQTGTRYFYPRSPCGERQQAAEFLRIADGFLSTLSLRRATCELVESGRLVYISIHALLAESDCQRCVQTARNEPFLSTLSLRRATCSDCRTWTYERLISIHALLAESDGHRCSPCGHPSPFLSTLSLRRATKGFSFPPIELCHISIHALLAESDAYLQYLCELSLQFLSTLSLRRATASSWLRI